MNQRYYISCDKLEGEHMYNFLQSRIPNLKKLQGKFKSGDTVYFYLSDAISDSGVLKGKIFHVNRNVTISQSNIMNKRSRCSYDLTEPCTYDIRLKSNNEYLYIEEHSISKNKRKIVNAWNKYVYAPKKRASDELQKIKDQL